MSEGHKIVVIGDDPAVCDRLANSLRAGGCAVSAVLDPKAAIKSLAHRPTELLVLEVPQVVPDGLALLRILTPVIRGRKLLLIGRAEGPTPILEAFRAGAADVLPAPWSAIDLENAVSRMMKDENLVSQKAIEGVQYIEIHTEILSSVNGIDQVTDLLTGVLAGYADAHTLKFLRVTLQESLRNALEHGNLGISSEEKDTLLEQGSLESEIERRLSDATMREKRIRVRMLVENDQVTVTITDAGVGFDWRSAFAAIDQQTSDDGDRMNGRGIRLIRHFYDTVVFNDVGNELTLKKQLRRERSEPSSTDKS